MLEKGFLGPIGDDLPSLIPLLFALLIFFGTFSFSFGVFNEKNTSFDADLAVLGISRILKGTSYITGISDFLQKCASINITKVKYRAGITNFFTAPQNYNAPLPDGQGYSLDPLPRSFSIGFFKNSNGEIFECTNLSRAETGAVQNEADEFFSGRPILVKIFPLVVEDERVVKPMHLVVVAWKN
ncbi:MAG: hypothetical protein HYW50_01030 [Candidatus Diapherotrites archaeon]|nr:hypothetical protein [Candidatus Diapherotrites archaeon]